MATYITSPTIIKPVGNKPKVIQEYVGLVNSKTSSVSIAHMKSLAGWIEPAQIPEFDEYTLVLRGELHVKTEDRKIIVKAGEAVIAHRGERIQYSTPHAEGAEYVAICLPAFSPNTVHREE